MKKKQLFFYLLFTWIASPMFSQENVVTSGGDILNSSGCVSYTVGQVFWSNVEVGEGSLYEGIQQPYSSEIVTGVEFNEIRLELFPNPTRETAILKIETEYIGLLDYALFDETARLIETNKINSSETPINLSGLANGIYILNIEKFSEKIKSFRIFKTK